MSRAIRNVIKRRHKQYSIQRYDRSGGSYDDADGLWIESADALDIVYLHLQPIVDKISDGVPAQRQVNQYRGWAVNGQEINNKDVVYIPEGSETGLFTTSDMIFWEDEFKEFTLTRSGEADNIDS